MNVGRLITTEGLEIALDSSQLEALMDYLHRQEINDALNASAIALTTTSGFIDPEEFEKALQAANIVRQQRAYLAAA